jgi:hypothetical protein
MYRILLGICVVVLFLPPSAWGQDNTDNQQPSTRQEIEQLKKENAEIKQEVADLKKAQADQAKNAEQDAQDFDKQMEDIQKAVNKLQSGLEGVVIAGDANFGFETVRQSNSTFFADVSPLILWQPVDSHILIEAAFDLNIEPQVATQADESTTVNVNLADISYEVCDCLIVGAGLFAVPFGQYHNHFDPPWINKFPDDPLAFDAIAPISEVGVFARGAIPSGTTRWTYDAYFTNGPNLITDDSTGNLGQLNYNDYTDLNGNKAAGGRIGFLPFSDMEMGYSLLYSMPNPEGFPNAHAFSQAADFHWKPLVKFLGGQLDFSSEWIWSSVTPETYDPTGALGFGPIAFDNYREGGYFSLGYRPTEADNKILRNFEFLCRFDSLHTPVVMVNGVTESEPESRWTLGVDYWLTPYCILKAAYEMAQERGGDPNEFVIQVGIGL